MRADDSKPLPMAAWNLRFHLAVSRPKRTCGSVYGLCTLTIRIVNGKPRPRSFVRGTRGTRRDKGQGEDRHCVLWLSGRHAWSGWR